MKRKRTKLLFVIILLLCGWFSWRLTSFNAGPKIRGVFSGAKPYFDPIYSPDPTISATFRGLIPSYFGMDESLGFSLTDSPDSLDLRDRFSRLSHVKLFSIHFTRCKIINLCPAATRGFPGFIVFDDCDFSQLPAEQRILLRPYDPSQKTPTKKVCIGDV